MKSEDLRKQLDAARARLLVAIAGVTEEQFKRTPEPLPDDPQPWSIAENLSHVLAIERTWAQRIALTLTEERPEILPSPPEAHAEGAAAGRRAPVPQLIHGLLASRREVERSLDNLADERLARTAWHPRLGQHLTIEWMLQKILEHENEHCLQIEALRRRLGSETVEKSAG